MRVLRRFGVIVVACAVPLAAAAAPGDARVAAAAKQHDINAVQLLIKQGADVSGAAADGATALHWAAYYDDVALVDLLIRAGAKTRVANDLGVTPLVLAAENSSAPVAERLLTAGADANAGPAETPLMVAARVGSADVVKLLITHGANVNAKEPSRDQTALMWAASQNHPAVVQALLQAGADVNARTKAPPRQKVSLTAGRDRPNFTQNGLTPLLFAARSGDVESAQLLLAAGANANDKTADDLSALVLATVRGFPKVAMLLLDHGADANAEASGYTALHWAAGSWETEMTTRSINVERGEWHTVTGLREGRLELVKSLLAHGANPNAGLQAPPSRAGGSRNPELPELIGATPLLLAALAGQPDVIRALIENGADPALRTKENGTALMAASGLGRVPGEVIVKESATLEAARLLIDRGADVNAVDDVGNTALHYAAYLRRESIVRLLVERGATLDVKNKYGETPVWMSELVMQFCGGGTFQITPSPTSAALRALGAHDTPAPYARYRPTEWPDIPRDRSQGGNQPPPVRGNQQAPGSAPAPACGTVPAPPPVR